VCVRDRAIHPNLDVEPLMAKSESEHEEDEAERQRLADRVLGVLEDAVYWGIALVLIIGSVALLIAQFNTMLALRESPVKTVMLEILDGLLLIFIFVELLYAVRACLRSHEIVAEPFLIVGILAGIKEIVVLSVEAATLLEKGPAFSRAVVEIGVLAGVVLALALAAFVLRERRRDTEDAGERASEEEQPVQG
jgi:uncharacterized membrane protein (DUF373 family)